MIDGLVAEGRLRGETRAALGRVRTGIAVQRGAPHPDLSTPEALKAALQAASAIYFPDAERSTAGIHFARVMQELGIHEHPKAGRGRPPPAGIEESGKATFPQEALQPRFRTYPSGAIAMREMAAAPGPGLIGCTQVTEINYTEGVELVGVLPKRFELATVYSAAATAGSAERVALAQNFIGLLTGADTLVLRTAGGFEA